MSTRQKILLLLSFPLVALVSALLIGQGSNVELIPTSSSYSTGPPGTKALYLLLQELHLAPVRYRKAFRDLDSHVGIMIVTDPKHTDYTRRQARNLEEWVKKGNQLLIFESARSSSSRAASVDSVSKLSLKSVVHGPASYFGLRLKEFPHQPRKELNVRLPELRQQIAISVSGETRWQEPSAEWTVLATDESGPLLLTKKIGEGRIFACSDPSLISNRYIDREQNLRLALGLMAGKGRRGQILFDEFHHGHRTEESFWTYVGASVFGWVLFQIAVGFAVFFYSRRAELAGRFRSLSRESGRSKLEYVDSMANIFETRKAASAALEAILQRFLGRVSRVIGIPLKSLEEESLSRARAKIPEGAVDLVALIKETRRAIRSGEQGEVLEAARSLARHESNLNKGLFRTLVGRDPTSAKDAKVLSSR
ncbi:MAG: hypothetical protein HY912_05700 [Desulfomonile tiedjei]|uniref:DUF4350 domain-containing protein n=1 Tax=Desulfomonile tiedjei TaxID=2358 RepID=A0A9D6Z5A3_9BACT|nr:hypothetical protein [Desulfomonile tiedjei]